MPHGLAVLPADVVVTRREVGPVDEEVLAVDAVERRLRHVGRGDLHLVAGVDGDRHVVL